MRLQWKLVGPNAHVVVYKKYMSLQDLQGLEDEGVYCVAGRGGAVHGRRPGTCSRLKATQWTPRKEKRPKSMSCITCSQNAYLYEQEEHWCTICEESFYEASQECEYDDEEDLPPPRDMYWCEFCGERVCFICRGLLLMPLPFSLCCQGKSDGESAFLQ